ncbi:MAG: hypothetical protein HQK86_10425 [Nitrospinae bacterium]|nr:hypothetical protein [Nitrospinota bacterium]
MELEGLGEFERLEKDEGLEGLEGFEKAEGGADRVGANLRVRPPVRKQARRYAPTSRRQ